MGRKAIQPKRVSKAVFAADAVIDTGTKERLRHDEVVLDPIVAGFKGDQVVGYRGRVKAPFALDRYRARGELCPNDPNENERRYRAGDRLRARWTIAGLEPHLVSAYSEMIAGGKGAEPAIARRDAYEAWVRAIRAVGIIASNEVITVCCLGEYVGRDRIEILRRGLKVLADYWGLG